MKLYKNFLLLHLKGALQYKVSFFLLVIGQALTSLFTFISILFLYDRFPTVKDYSFGDIILCYGVMLMSYTIAEMFGRGFDSFARMISNGEFDRMLLRPRSEIFLVFTSRMELARIGRLIQAVVILVYGMKRSEVIWAWDKWITLLGMIIGGSVLFICVFIIFASFCFFTLESIDVVHVFTDGARTFSRYPLDIYGKGVLKFCTFVIPYALVQYYPLLYLTGRVTNQIFILIPLLACFIIVPCIILWKFGIKHYQSTGS